MPGHGIGNSWFIIALVLVEIIAFFLFKLDIKLRLPILAFLAIGGFVLNYYVDDLYFWNFPAVLIGLLFFECGTLVKSGDLIQRIIQKKRILVISVIACIVLNGTSVFFNGTVDMWRTQYSNVGWFLIGALSGTYLVFLLSVFLEKRTKIIKKPLIFYEKNTLLIIEFHVFPLYKLIEIVLNKLGFPYNDNALSGNIEGFIYALICLIIFIPVILVFNKYFPWFVGKNKPQTKEDRVL